MWGALSSRPICSLLTRKTLLATGNFTSYTYDAENRLTKVEDFAAGNPTPAFTSTYRYDGLGRRIEKVANGQTKRYIYDGEDILLEYNGANVLQARYTHGPGIDEPLSRTPMVPGVGSGHTAVLASTPDGLTGPVVDDGIKVNGQVFIGFVLATGVPTPAIGQPITTTGSHLPVAPINVTTASSTGTLAVDLIDTGGIGGNAPLYLVVRDQATNQVVSSQLLFAARPTFASTTPIGTPVVVASTTVSTVVAGATLFYHQDGLGTVTDLTDSTGATAKSYSYDAYGTIVDQTGTVDQPYTYTGREFDSESGLMYYRARYYDPNTGRFLQKDPIGFNGGDLTLYGYARQNGTNRIDPFGLAPPPIMPGRTGADICENIKLAKQLGPIDFYDKVRSGGDWDFKLRDKDHKKYEDFGNYHFAVVGRAAGWSPDVLRRGAGAYSIYSGTSPEGSSWPGPFGQPPYGDDFIDHAWINQGIKDYDSGYWEERCNHVCPLGLVP